MRGAYEEGLILDFCEGWEEEWLGTGGLRGRVGICFFVGERRAEEGIALKVRGVSPACYPSIHCSTMARVLVDDGKVRGDIIVYRGRIRYENEWARPVWR